MSPADPGELIRCDCGHSAAQHSTAGCTAGPVRCRCLKTFSAVIQEELALLRPGWLSKSEGASGS
jgi:hypothetical protein